MHIFNIRKGFATNSSSSHSILVLPSVDKKISTDEYSDFGWQFFTLFDQTSKENYFATALKSNLEQCKMPPKEIDTYLTELFGDDIVDRISNAYIDHQSVVTFPRTWDNKGINKEFISEMAEYIKRPDVVVAGGNDNDSKEHELTKVGTKSPLDNLPKESSGDHFIARKENDYWTIFSRSDGSKMRFSFTSEVAPEKALAPELADIKITDFCPYACEFCYQDSTLEGKHASLDNIKKIADALEKAQVFEVACLAEDTLVLSENGYVAIQKLKIGDKLYSSDGTVKKIDKIKISEKDCIKLTGNKGFYAVCTPDHPFIINGEIVEAKDTLNKNLDQIKSFNNKNTIEHIDLSQYMVIASEHPKSRSGSKIGELYRHSSSSNIVPSIVKIDEELMFFYGIVVAEGFEKGIALHVNEIDLANQLGQKYNKISNNSGYRILPNQKNGIRVEFKTPSFFQSLFFKGMSCGYGAENKNLSFLYKINNKNYIKKAIYGLLIGDGCFRKKENNKLNKTYYDFCIHLKTISKVLATDLISLLKVHFDVDASLYEGVSPTRFIEGRELNSSIYYSVDINGKNNIDKIFPEIFENDVDYQKIGNSIYSPNKSKNHIKIKDICSVGKKTVYDLTLEDDSTHIFSLSHGVLTHNCGGGETTLHPNFVEILKMFKDKNIVPNFTTKNLNLLRQSNALDILEHCGAMAFSVQSVEDIHKVQSALMDFEKRSRIETASSYYMDEDQKTSIWNPKINFQFVMGSMPMKEFKEMLQAAQVSGKRVTLLGYKENGRGSSFAPHDYSDWLNVVEKMQKTSFLQVSIDTALASEFEKELLNKKVDSSTFHTTEGTFSAYVDAIKMALAPSSYVGLEQSQPFDEEWLEKYKSMKAKPEYKKTIKISV